MNELPSARFRKVYATLRVPTVVTVNGHPIGTYTPIMSSVDSRFVQAIRPGEPASQTVVMSERNRDGTASFHEFRPVPKPGRK